MELSQGEGFTLIDINADSKRAFRWSHQGGHLEVAKWLDAINQNDNFALINIDKSDQDASKMLRVLGSGNKFTVKRIKNNNLFAVIKKS